MYLIIIFSGYAYLNRFSVYILNDIFYLFSPNNVNMREILLKINLHRLARHALSLSHEATDGQA